MWKKPETQDPQPETITTPRTPVEPSRERATIGPSIYIKGDLTGEEDLIIQGHVEGKIDLKEHSVTIGKNGRIRADVFGRVIHVEGEVQGNLFGQEKVVIRQTGSVRGNLTAPRVTLEEGSKFKGSIDMDAGPSEKSVSASNPSESKKSPEPSAETPKEPEGNRKLALGLKMDSGTSKT